jgi:hypothetical protein
MRLLCFSAALLTPPSTAGLSAAQIEKQLN